MPLKTTHTQDEMDETDSIRRQELGGPPNVYHPTSRDQKLQGGDKGIYIGRKRCPAGDKTAIHHITDREPLFKDKVFLQARYRLAVKQDKLLVCRGIAIHLITLADEGVTQSHRLIDGMKGNLEVQVVGHQRVKLDAQQTALGHQGTMLLDDGKEMGRCIVVREDNRLAT